MLILEDTRQQEKKHETKHEYFRRVGIHYNRTALYCGDYTLPANQSVCIDTKKDIHELIGDIQVKQMPKKEVKDKVYEICENKRISFDLANDVYHAICDDDTDRFAEKDINEVCCKYAIPEGIIVLFQALYVKRHGFFHRGLKRAQNSGIRLYILVENEDKVTSLDDLFHWHNPRLDKLVNSNQMLGFWKNGKPIYKKVRKYPYAATGEWLEKACLTMELKYGCKFLFCKPEDSGAKILELLGVNEYAEKTS
ncbi:hypothetical protein [Lacrimispora indolis]|uniref:hypothetical protein n=1 Tax=Lacrimispora indolis TaxID=69825 RepID=UPI00045EA88B|nr:hypothetical protein [Lacrimispora indolis]